MYTRWGLMGWNTTAADCALCSRRRLRLQGCFPLPTSLLPPLSPFSISLQPGIKHRSDPLLVGSSSFGSVVVDTHVTQQRWSWDRGTLPLAPRPRLSPKTDGNFRQSPGTPKSQSAILATTEVCREPWQQTSHFTYSTHPPRDRSLLQQASCFHHRAVPAPRPYQRYSVLARTPAWLRERAGETARNFEISIDSPCCV